MLGDICKIFQEFLNKHKVDVLANMYIYMYDTMVWFSQ